MIINYTLTTMKKHILIALSLAFGLTSFAQKKELKMAEKAIKKSNYAEAKTALSQAEALMASMDDKTKEKFHLLKGQAFYANGAGSDADIDTAVKSLSSLGNTNEGGNALRQSMVNSFITKATADLETKSYSKSSANLNRAYRLSPQDTLYLYNAASLSASAEEYDKALMYYIELKDLGFTGISSEYVATNKETEEEESFVNKLTRDLSVTAGTHIAPKEKKTESKIAEIVKNVALIYVQKGENEKALAAMQEAKEKNPNDSNLILTEANIYYKMGNIDKFKELLVQAATKDPNNADLQYNLGVISMDSGDDVSAKKYYEKAIEIDPGYANAYINMSALVLGKEEKLIEEMNGLGTSSADNKRYDELTAQRQGLYKEAIPYLEKVLSMDDKNLQAAKTLMNIYSVIDETEKFKAMKMKVEMMETGN